MRLRRLEFVIIGLTLAFACFMGGFFTGRSWSAVNIVAVATESGDTLSVGMSIAPLEQQTSEPQTSVPQASEPGSQSVAQIPDTVSAPEAAGDSGAGQPTEATGAPKAGDGKININLASQSELMDLPGIGNVLASRIVDYRRQNGDFSRIEDIRNVSGIGEKRYEAIQDKITIG